MDKQTATKKINNMKDLTFEKTKVEEAANEMLCGMMKENSPKLLSFFLSCLAKNMEDANAATMELSCELDIKGERYKIATKSKLVKI
jgi:hypothetical protein